jgi:hypothetical protein
MVHSTDEKQQRELTKVEVGSFIKLNRHYGPDALSRPSIFGTVIRYQPLDVRESATGRVAKIKLLVTTGIIWDLTLFTEDDFEVLQ